MMNINYLKQITEPVFFVANDVSRGIGLEKLLPNYHIICLDDHPLVDYLINQRISVFCLERVLGEKNIMVRNSGLILNHPLVLSFIKEKSFGHIPNIMAFKPQGKIEQICAKENFRLILNSKFLNEKFEDKLSFFDLCRKHDLPVPPGEIGFLSDFYFTEVSKKYGERMVVQSGRGWAGNSTYFINSEDEFNRLSGSLPAKIKISSFIEGKTCLNNAVIYRDKIFMSKPALQVKANPLLTGNPGGTGGRQWPAGVSKKIEQEIKRLTLLVGKMMSKEGYKGFFGLDFLIDKDENVFVSECNARLTASTSFYTKMEIMENVFPLLGYHLLSFFPEISGVITDYNVLAFTAGEIISRNFSKETEVVVKGLTPGIYDKNINLLKKTYFLDEKTDNLWLSTVGTGRKVNPEIELIRIDCFGQVCDSEGNLNDNFSGIIKGVRKEILNK